MDLNKVIQNETRRRNISKLKHYENEEIEENEENEDKVRHMISISLESAEMKNLPIDKRQKKVPLVRRPSIDSLTNGIAVPLVHHNASLEPHLIIESPHVNCLQFLFHFLSLQWNRIKNKCTWFNIVRGIASTVTVIFILLAMNDFKLPFSSNVSKKTEEKISNILQFESFDLIRSHKNYEKFQMKTCGLQDYDYDHEDVPSLKKYPFQAGIVLKQFNESRFGCSGSFIQADLLLTAAHCQLPEWNFSISEIYFTNPSTNNITIIKSDEFLYIRHSKFIYGNFEKNYDLALIKLKRPVNNHTICLPINETSLFKNFMMAELIDEGSIYRTKIKEVSVSIVNVNECKKQYERERKSLKFYESDETLEQRSIQFIFCASNGANFTEAGTSGSSIFTSNGNGFISYGTLSMGATSGKNLTDVYMNNGAFITWILDNA